MIHQCYFEASQRARLFASPLYRSFGLYTAVNPDVSRNCPELENPNIQHALCEYGAMLHLWRNPELDSDPWIGFTSYRQFDKFPTILYDRCALEENLARYDVVGWGFFEFFDAASGRPISVAEHRERFHPGITSFLWQLLFRCNDTLPANYLNDNTGLYCNYWVMSKPNFDEFMRWSYPLVRWCLDHPEGFLQSHTRILSYVIECLFMVWYGLRGKRLLNVGQTVRVGFGPPRPSDPNAQELPAGSREDVSPELEQRVEQARREVLRCRSFTFHRIGQDRGVIELLENGAVGDGKKPYAGCWLVRASDRDVVLEFVGPEGCTCRLLQGEDGVWRGQMVVSPGVSMELIPNG